MSDLPIVSCAGMSSERLQRSWRRLGARPAGLAAAWARCRRSPCRLAADRGRGWGATMQARRHRRSGSGRGRAGSPPRWTAVAALGARPSGSSGLAARAPPELPGIAVGAAGAPTRGGAAAAMGSRPGERGAEPGGEGIAGTRTGEGAPPPCRARVRAPPPSERSARREDRLDAA